MSFYCDGCENITDEIYVTCSECKSDNCERCYSVLNYILTIEGDWICGQCGIENYSRLENNKLKHNKTNKIVTIEIENYVD